MRRAGVEHPRHHRPEVLGPRRVDELALDPLRQAGVRQDRAGRGVRPPAAAECLERLEAGVRAGAAVHADHVDRRAREQRRRASAGVEPSASSSSSPNVISATIGRSAVARRASSIGDQQVAQVDERLEHEQVDAALEQAVDLLAERLADPRLVEAQQVARRRAERTDRAGDEHVAAADVARLAGDARRGRLNRCVSAASPNPASRTRFAPNVAVSMRSAPASRYSRWIAPTSSGRVVASSSRQARWGTPPANSSVPIAPSARSGRAASRSRKRSRSFTGPAYPSAADEPRRRPERQRPSAPRMTCGGRGRPL